MSPQRPNEKTKRRRGRAAAFAFALVLATPPAVASTTQENLAKYTRLRQRLTTEFMVVGDGPGQSIPAAERTEQEGFIKWADATINLGFYLGVLASEYHLRSKPTIFPGADGGDSNAAGKTLQELYHALFALDRLDNVADQSFPPPCSTSPSRNGFFLRDDVPGGFHQSFPPLTSMQSDFIDPALTNKEMSQDQVYHVLMGLALVKHLVPASVVVGGKTLRTWAMEQARRIGEHFATGNWAIKNAACGNRTVARGAQAIGYSGGTRLAFGFLSDGAYVPSTPLDVFATLRNPSNPTYNDSDNMHMALSIAAVGNAWGATTADDLATLSKIPDWPLYPILHRTLHGNAASAFCKTGVEVNARARAMLDEMPANGEPANPLPGPPAVHGFTACNRFIRPKAQHYVGQPGGAGRRYSGTDFLLLHNLYAAASPATWTQGPGADPCALPDQDGGTSSGSSPSANGPSGGVSNDDGAPLVEGERAEDGAGCGCGVVSSRAGSTSAIACSVALGLLFVRQRRRAGKASTS